MEYRQKLVDQWKSDSTVRRVAERRHMPQSVHSAVKLKREMLEARKVKEDRRRKHTKAGREKPKPERKSEYDVASVKWQFAVSRLPFGFFAGRYSFHPWVWAGVETRITVSVSTGSCAVTSVRGVSHAIGTLTRRESGGAGDLRWLRQENRRWKGEFLLTANRGHHCRAEVDSFSRCTFLPPYRHIALSLFAVFLLYIACHIHRTDPCPDYPSTALIPSDLTIEHIGSRPAI